MRVRSHLFIMLAVLLVSCDKQKGSDNAASTTSPKSRVTRASRTARKDAPSSLDGFREALNAALKIAPLEARDQALAEVARDALKLSPETSAEAINQLSTNSVGKLPLIQYCAMFLAKQNPQEALAWTASLGSEKEIAAAKMEIAQVLVWSDPESAIKLIPQSAIAGAGSNEAVGQILERWTTNAPANAAAWVANLAPGGARKASIKTVASQWVLEDPQAALSWIASLKNASVRKDASRAIAEVLAKHPSAIRAELLATADPAIRSEIDQQIDQIKQDEE